MTPGPVFPKFLTPGSDPGPKEKSQYPTGGDSGNSDPVPPLQPCGCPANLGLFFVDLRVFLKACGLLVFGLVLIEICLFFADICLRIAFFQV